MQMAREQLERDGVKINLLAYEVGNDPAQVQKLVDQADFASTDLIVGPLYGNPIKAILPFANEHKIGQINPITNNGQILANNPVAYLFQPSVESQARQAATYALQAFPVKTTMIFYTASPKDSLLAHAYRQKFTEGGGKVLAFKKITPATLGQISATVTGMDETKLGHVFIPASNQNIAINAMSALDKEFAKYPVLTMADWLQYQMINFEQFELRNVHFIFPEFIDYRKPEVIAFKQAYVQKRNLIPSIYAYQGYELLMLFGRALTQFGTNFHAGLQSQPPRPGPSKSARRCA
jgi:ABC-type branched-subunit amino acid transport system substrate-binding protein